MAAIGKLILRPLCLLTVITVLWPGASLLADPADCRLDPVTQEFQYSREFQGVPEPITWKISRQVEFLPARQEGMLRVHESLEMQLPEFRDKFARYLGSAKLDTCELRFNVMPRTPTAHGSTIDIPIKVFYETAKCKTYTRMCRHRGYVFHNCDKSKRRITQSDAAEIDVQFTIDLKKPKMESVVSWEQTPYYSDLFEPAARSLFKQVLDDASAALAFITGTLGSVSIASLGEELQAFRVKGEFTVYDASIYQADSSYRLNSEQACAVRDKLLAQYPESDAPVSP